MTESLASLTEQYWKPSEVEETKDVFLELGKKWHEQHKLEGSSGTSSMAGTVKENASMEVQQHSSHFMSSLKLVLMNRCFMS